MNPEQITAIGSAIAIIISGLAALFASKARKTANEAKNKVNGVDPKK